MEEVEGIGGQARARVLRRRRRGRPKRTAAVLRWGRRGREGERVVEMGGSVPSRDSRLQGRPGSLPAGGRLMRLLQLSGGGLCGGLVRCSAWGREGGGARSLLGRGAGGRHDSTLR